MIKTRPEDASTQGAPQQSGGLPFPSHHQPAHEPPPSSILATSSKLQHPPHTSYLPRRWTHSRIPRWLSRWFGFELNFYRCHLLAFIFIPFIFAVIFLLADDMDPAQAKKPAFIDCLFMCHSAMTMTGLNTILLSPLNRFQQALLYILMSIGSTTIISMIMIFIRLRAFKQRFRTIISSTTPRVISKPIPVNGTPPQLKFPDKVPRMDVDHGSALGLPQLGSVEDLHEAHLGASCDELDPLDTRGLPRTPLARAQNDVETLASTSPRHLEFFNVFGLGNMPMVTTPETSSPVVPRTNPPVEHAQRPILVRRNSDGGVVGAHSSASDVGPLLDPSQLRSNTLLSILKSSPTILNNLLSHHLTFEKSTRQNTQANRHDHFFPRSTTLDQTAIPQRNYLLQSHARDRSLTFAPQQLPENLDHQATAARGRTARRGLIRDEISAASFSRLDSIHSHRRDSRPLQACQLEQLDGIAGMEPELTDTQAESHMFQQRKTTGILHGVPPEHDEDGLRRRIKPMTSISGAPGVQHHRRPSGSIPATSQRHAPRKQSISGHSMAGPSLRRRSSFTGLPRTSSTTDFGGFPNPLFVLLKRLGALVRGRRNTSQHSLEFVRTASLAGPAFDQKERHKLTEWLFGTGTGLISERIREVKTVSYIKFNAIVGRNSNFLTLTSAQEEELGGLEYRALSMLLKVVIGYWVLFQLVAIVILIPYLETPLDTRRFPEVFDAPGGTNRVWYAIWITCSAFTNGGMSLIDAGFTVFHGGYLLMLVCSALIIAGNTGYPIILRVVIWTLSKVCRESTPEEHRKVGGGKKEVLNFLLDHPRRCFVYLFPSRQTWYLFFILLLLTFIDWFFFLILDIGNSKIESIPIGTRIIVGLLQSLSVRAAGFSTISLGDLAPAVQVLFIIMMYIAVYPIAISIRATNVYEERSLGIFHLDEQLDHESDEEGEYRHEERGRGGLMPRPAEHTLNLETLQQSSPDETPNSNASLRGKRGKSGPSHAHSFSAHSRRFSHHREPYPRTDTCDRDSVRSSRASTPSYLALHIRKQLAFDIWWLALAVWCICIAERNKIVSAQATTSPSFSIFSIMFEVVSAYGTIGLSVGLPDSATSMVGGFSTFSKLVVIAVMLRGRHRGLPIAIDRAVILPYDQKSKPNDEDDGHEYRDNDEAGGHHEGAPEDSHRSADDAGAESNEMHKPEGLDRPFRDLESQ
ncbi:hypothetical protein PCANC_16808 [Puccinia coronata f. sp. avenae]|uniref:Potassium transport protein n=1 Tax=Puccinia coronata f. sp. avenae TaxID=200324 RepID=A0A2N5UNZ9_9BASI|nr:hypothetical protein PCANC_16808 [Puccinia coronata f. sp. avenae]